MRGIARLFILMLVSVAVVWVMQLLPQAQSANSVSPAETIPKGNVNLLSEHNLVDRMTALNLELKILRVEWNHSELLIDLEAGKGAAGQAKAYRDWFELSQFGLRQMENVPRVFVRIMEKSETSVQTSSQLVAAMDARKENVSKYQTPPPENDSLLLAEYLHSRYRITYTQRWKGST